MERIARLCPNLSIVKVLMEDLNFRELELLHMVQEVIFSCDSMFLISTAVD